MKHISLLAGGAMSGQAVTLVFSPFITRMYGPEAFGILSLFTAFFTIIATLGALAYPASIVLPEDDREAISLVRVSLVFSILTTGAITLVLLTAGEAIMALFNMSALVPFTGFLVLAVLLHALVETSRYWLVRRRGFRAIASAVLATAVTINLVKVAVGFVHPTALSLVSATVLGHFITLCLMAYASLRLARAESHRLALAIGTGELADAARKYRDFPLYRAPQGLINSLSQGLPIIMLAAFYDAATAGYFALAVTLVSMPIRLVGGAVIQVLYPRFNEARLAGENLQRHIGRATLALLATGVIPFTCIALVAPPLFEFVFGEGWHQAGLYAQPLALYLFMQFANRAVIAAIPVLGLQAHLLAYEVLTALTRAGAIYAGIKLFGEPVAAVVFYAAIGSLLYVGLIGWVIVRSQDSQGTAPRKSVSS